MTKVQVMIMLMGEEYLNTLVGRHVVVDRRCQRHAQWVKQHTEKGHPESAARCQKKLDKYLKDRQELEFRIRALREGLAEIAY